MSNSLQPTDCSLPVHGILQARILEPFPSPGDLPKPGIKPRSPALQADSFPSEPPGKPIQHLTFTLMVWERASNRSLHSRWVILYWNMDFLGLICHMCLVKIALGLQSGLFPGIKVSLVLIHSLIQSSQQGLIVGAGGGHQGKVPGQHEPDSLLTLWHHRVAGSDAPAFLTPDSTESPQHWHSH